MQPLHRLAAAALSVASLLTTAPASASLMDAIDALSPGDMYRVLFVTSTTRDATSTDIADYNSFVTTAANGGSVTGPLGLSWTAVASTDTVNAQANTGVSSADVSTVFFFNTSGDLVASSGQDLWFGNLTSAIEFDEDGVSVSSNVWTGTAATGFTDVPLGDPFAPTVGDSTSQISTWVSIDTAPEENLLPLYGVSEKVTVAETALPEPSTITLFGLALFAGVAVRRRGLANKAIALRGWLG